MKKFFWDISHFFEICVIICDISHIFFIFFENIKRKQQYWIVFWKKRCLHVKP